jgi:hypothetical protein
MTLLMKAHGDVALSVHKSKSKISWKRYKGLISPLTS